MVVRDVIDVRFHVIVGRQRRNHALPEWVREVGGVAEDREAVVQHRTDGGERACDVWSFALDALTSAAPSPRSADGPKTSLRPGTFPARTFSVAGAARCSGFALIESLHLLMCCGLTAFRWTRRLTNNRLLHEVILTLICAKTATARAGPRFARGDGVTVTCGL